VDHGDSPDPALLEGLSGHRLRASHGYTAGSTNRVSSIELTSPPITTVASGRWT
jgi:hypothetical protein